MRNIIQRIRINQLFPDQDCLIVEIRENRTRTHDLIFFTFISHKGGNNILCGNITLDRIYAAQFEIALGKIDKTFNVKLDGSCLV